MSRARERKQQETQQFLQENPEAIEHDTQLSVAQNPGTGFFEVQVGGSKGVLFDARDEGGDSDLEEDETIDPLITTLSDLDTNEIDFDFMDGGEDGFLTLTEYGMGIAGEDDNLFRKSDGELKKDAKDIREGEVLEVDAVRFPREEHELNIQVEGGEDDEFGMTGANIEFTVLNNKSGSVELLLEQDGPDQLITFDIAQGNKGLMDNIGFVAFDDEVFGGFELSVSGEVQIALTGIDFSTNYEGDTILR